MIVLIDFGRDDTEHCVIVACSAIISLSIQQNTKIMMICVMFTLSKGCDEFSHKINHITTELTEIYRTFGHEIKYIFVKRTLA